MIHATFRLSLRQRWLAWRIVRRDRQFNGTSEICRKLRATGVQIDMHGSREIWLSK